ncbi:hypothetical protein [Citrobacter freundii]|uniref:hypothetical protein n=1 Tax=Citrobacter freundii TaxID=546 RepID=UPI0039C9CC59
MTALNKQALRQTAEKAQEHGVFNMDIHSQTVLALLDELEAAEKRIADQHGIILSARNFISEYAVKGDMGADEFVKILDRAAGIGVKGE